MWQILDTGKSNPENNMAIDAELLEKMASPDAVPTLHLYDWASPSATYGYFTDPSEHLCMKAVTDTGLQLARRPTGGGIIFHVTDFAFSVAVPATHPAYSVNTLDNYAFVNRVVIRVVTEYLLANRMANTLALFPGDVDSSNRRTRHFCMAKPTQYDVMLDRRKVAGGAQRRTRHGFLHQGSISLAPPDEMLLSEVLLPGTDILEAMQQYTYALLPTTSSQDEISTARQALAHIFRKRLCCLNT